MHVHRFNERTAVGVGMLEERLGAPSSPSKGCRLEVCKRPFVIVATTRSGCKQSTRIRDCLATPARASTLAPFASRQAAVPCALRVPSRTGQRGEEWPEPERRKNVSSAFLPTGNRGFGNGDSVLGTLLQSNDTRSWLRESTWWALPTRRVLDHFASGWFSGWASMNALKRRQFASTCRINGKGARSTSNRLAL